MFSDKRVKRKLSGFEEDVQTLMELGLTVSQAKVCIVLCNLEKAKATVIWKASKVARQDIYRILFDLQEAGLVERVIAVPTEYRALPVAEMGSILLQRKKNEVSALETKIKKLVETFQYRKLQAKFPIDEHQCIMIPERETLGLRINETFDRTQRSIDVTSSVKRLTISLSKYKYAESLKRGVRVRIISNLPEDKNYFERIAPLLLAKPNFKLRYVSHSPSTVFSCFDEREAYICTDSKAGLEEVSTLWCNYPSIVYLVRNYFETQWKTAMEGKPLAGKPAEVSQAAKW